MANAAIATEVHEALDVHRHFAAQVAFDRKLRDDLAQPGDLGFRQVLDLRARIDLRGLASHERTASANAEDVRQRDAHVLVRGDIDARYTCHCVLTSTALALALLVARILADHAHDAAT